MDYYQTQKDYLRRLINEFELTNNLFKLVEAMRVGTKILETEGFPTKEFALYKIKYDKKKSQDFAL